MQINQIREKIIDTVYAKNTINVGSLSSEINITKDEYKEFNIALKNLEKNHIINNMKGKLSSPQNYFIGYLQTFKKGEDFIFFKNKKYAVIKGEDYTAIHGDKVVFEIVDKYLQTVRVISTIKRKSAKISGTYVEYNGIGFVVPDNDRINVDIYIQKDKVVPTPYDRVLVKINEYKVFGKPEGIIERKLYEDLDKEESALGKIIDKYNIQQEFPADVARKAITLNTKIKSSMLENRIDLRDEDIFTIDGKDAKDFDDAISVLRTESGFELGVYIADVTYYVEEHGVIDKCAFERGTSYYLDNTVIPMLPFALSNGVCSLNEGENKLCVGMKLYYDNKGNLLDKQFFEGVMCSKKRFTYEEINEYLAGKNPDFEKQNPDLLSSLYAGFELADLLNKKRINNGCIDFEFGELQLVKDSAGNIVNFKVRERGRSNDMIEEFMIAANEAVASLFAELGHPFIYRTHQVPFEEKVNTFLEICKSYGVDTSMVNVSNMNSKQFKELISAIENEDLKKCINMNLITCMKQAKYTKETGDHFGLASNYYCHFTSPIRRYPDLFIHRLVKKYIRKTLNNDVTRELYEKTSETVAKHCCFTERNADRAEEELDKIQIMQYLSAHPEREYTALIYSITKSGISVLVNDIITGAVKIRNATPGENASEVVSDDKVYRVGDRLRVTFKEYNVKNAKLVFEVVEE